MRGREFVSLHCRRSLSRISSMSSRASLTRFKSVGYLMSAEGRRRPSELSRNFLPHLNLNSLPELHLRLARDHLPDCRIFFANPITFLFNDITTSIGRRFRECVCSEALKVIFIWKLLNPRKYWRYGFSITLSTTSRSFRPRISLISKAPSASRRLRLDHAFWSVGHTLTPHLPME